MLVEWFARRALDNRLEAQVERTYREIVDELAGGERDPEELETTLASRYHQLAEAVGDRWALVLSACVFASAWDALNQTIGAGEAAGAVADRIAGYCCAVSGLDDAAFRKLFTQMKPGDRQVAQGIADDRPTHVVLTAFAIEHQRRDASTGRRFTIRHFIDTYNASDGPIHPPRHVTHPPEPVEAVYYLSCGRPCRTVRGLACCRQRPTPVRYRDRCRGGVARGPSVRHLPVVAPSTRSSTVIDRRLRTVFAGTAPAPFARPFARHARVSFHLAHPM